MKRNLFSAGHRKSNPEAGFQPAGPASSRPAPRRQRTIPQRRDPYAATEERSPGAPLPGSSDRSRHNARFLNDDDHRAEAERRQKAELKRLREEVLEIARELKSLERPDTARPGAGFGDRLEARDFGARTKASGMSRSRKFAADLRQPDPFTVYDAPVEPTASHSAPAPEPRGHRQAEARPQAPGEHRQPPADARTRAAPARAKIPAPAIVPGVKTPATNSRPTKRVRVGLVGKLALLAVLMLAGTGLITIKLWGGMPALAPARQKMADMLVHISAATPAPSEIAIPARRAPPANAFAAPDTYGVYAVSDGQLTPLEPLPIRVPDARVSISSTISKPAPAPLANGHLSFVVYHRELATSVPETASVRIVAKVMQATAFAGGKPKAMAIEETWAVRGGAIDLRIAPVPTNNEMIVIRPADPKFTLSPGRYVLMFKNQAYDFSVAGTVSDTAQCLERADLQDRSVYSECRELPAQPVSF